MKFNNVKATPEILLQSFGHIPGPTNPKSYPVDVRISRVNIPNDNIVQIRAILHTL